MNPRGVMLWGIVYGAGFWLLLIDPPSAPLTTAGVALIMLSSGFVAGAAWGRRGR